MHTFVICPKCHRMYDHAVTECADCKFKPRLETPTPEVAKALAPVGEAAPVQPTVVDVASGKVVEPT